MVAVGVDRWLGRLVACSLGNKNAVKIVIFL